MGKEVFIVIAAGIFVATRFGSGATPSHDLGQSIADCKAMSDVTYIVEGRFKSSKSALKTASKFDGMKLRNDEQARPAKPIYLFKPDAAHLGKTGVVDNRTGKQTVKSLVYIIREGEAPEGLKGKGIICYKGSNPRTIKSVHSVR